MEITLTIILICCAAFFIAGFVDSIAGGGGLITMPVLLLLGLPAHYTLGTAKLSSCLGSLTALITFWRKGAVIKEVVILGVITSYLGAAGASGVTLLLSNELMTIIMIFMLPLGLLISLFCGALKLDDQPLPKKGLWWRVSAIGLSVGLLRRVFRTRRGKFLSDRNPSAAPCGFSEIFRHSQGVQYRRQSRRSHNLCIGRNRCIRACGSLRHCQHSGQHLGAAYAVKVGPRLIRNMLYVVLFMLLVSLVVKFVI